MVSWQDISRIIPEILICSFGLLVLLCSFFRYKRGWIFGSFLSLVGLIVTIAWVIHALKSGVQGEFMNQSYIIDRFSGVFKLLILCSTLLVLLGGYSYKGIPKWLNPEFYSLLLFGTLAMMLMVSSTDLLLIYLAMEFTSITSYILAGLSLKNRASNEAAIKYLLIGAASSAAMLFGMSWLYGISGSTNVYDIGQALTHGHVLIANTTALYLSLGMVLVGLGFKVALVPFHVWVPDVYEGAPTPVTAFLSVAPKVAGFAVLFRIFYIAFPENNSIFVGFSWKSMMALLAFVTMTIGNLAAIGQNNVKRLLAYSSIAHMGYIMIGFVVGRELGLNAVVYYLMAYIAMNVGAFLVVAAVADKTGGEDIADYSGLWSRAPMMAIIMTVFLLSLTGLPPFGGFIGKFMLFAGAIKEGWIWLAVAAILNSVVSLYYYARVFKQMFLTSPDNRGAVKNSFFINLTLIITGALTLLLGIFPQFFINIAKYSDFFFTS